MTETVAPAKPQIDDSKELERTVRRPVEAFEPVGSIYSAVARAAMPAKTATTT